MLCTDTKNRKFVFEKYSFLTQISPKTRQNARLLESREGRADFYGWMYLLPLTSLDQPVLYWSEMREGTVHLDRVTALGRTINVLPS